MHGPWGSAAMCGQGQFPVGTPGGRMWSLKVWAGGSGLAAGDGVGGGVGWFWLRPDPTRSGPSLGLLGACRALPD